MKLYWSKSYSTEGQSCFRKLLILNRKQTKSSQVFISSDASNIHQSQSDIQLSEEFVQTAGCAAKTPTADLYSDPVPVPVHVPVPVPVHVDSLHFLPFLTQPVLSRRLYE